MKEKLKKIANNLVETEINVLNNLLTILNYDVLEEVAILITQRNGKIIFSGMGKSGLVAKKISAMVCSMGVQAVFLHSAEAGHGDMGIISKNDLIFIFSNSGEGNELENVINFCKIFNNKIIAVTGDNNSYLAKNSDFPIILPPFFEVAGDMPIISSMVMSSFGDILILMLKDLLNVSNDDYLLNHPSGKIGKKMRKFLLLFLLLSNTAFANDNISKMTNLTLFTENGVTVDAAEVTMYDNDKATAKNITAKFEKGTLKGNNGTYNIEKNEIIVDGNIEIDFIGKILSEKIYFYPKKNLIYTDNDCQIESGNIFIKAKNLSLDTNSMVIILRKVKIKNNEKFK